MDIVGRKIIFRIAEPPAVVEPDEIVKIPHLDLTALNLELKRNPGLYAYYASLHVILSTQLEEDESELSSIRGRVGSIQRSRLSAIPGKGDRITDARIMELVSQDDEVVKKTQQLAQLRQEVGLLDVLVKGIGQKKDALEAIGHNLRKEQLPT